jgi:hypothetical protein
MARKDVIVYFCDGSCSGDIREKKGQPGGHMIFVADGTKVTLTFVNNPFSAGGRTFDIPANSFVKKKFANVTGRFKYSVNCHACPGGQDDLEMIIEL